MITAAARLGVTWWSDRTLTYVKLGGAWAEQTLTVGCIFGPLLNGLSPFGAPPGVPRCHNPANQFSHGFSASEGKLGGLVGVGTEFGLTRQWSAKGEVNVIWFDDDEITASDGTRLIFGASHVQAKIGVNYRFDQPFLPY
jgi:opacity protein-like surface antigen